MERPRTKRRSLSVQGHSLSGAGAPVLSTRRDGPGAVPSVVLILAGLVAAWGSGCQRAGDGEASSVEEKTMTADSPEFAAINQVLEDHAGRLMTIPGVTGVAIGLLDDEETPCLKILITKSSPELSARLPETLEGHPVVVEETGVIRPLDD
jgi:hypothetical protein